MSEITEPWLPSARHNGVNWRDALSRVAWKFLGSIIVGVAVAAVLVAWPTEPYTAVEPLVPLAAVPSAGIPCTKKTGGTCFGNDCDLARNSSCNRETCLWHLCVWRSCDCMPDQCAHKDGKCYRMPDPNEGAVSALLRTKHQYTIAAVLVPMGRSGVTANIVSSTGLDRVAGANFNVDTFFDFTASWGDLANAQEFGNLRQKIGATLSKLIGLHYGQCLFILAGFIAYRNYMGPVQY